MNLMKGVRPLDHVLTLVMVALAVGIALENMWSLAGDEVAHPIESHSAWLIPVFVVGALPILWRRRNIVAAIGVSFVVLAASIPIFGWVTRCGWALPLSIALAYAVARFGGSRQNQILGLLGVLAVQVVTLVQDASTGGLGALPLSIPVAALFYGIGWFVNRRTPQPVTERTLDLEHASA